MIELTQEEVRLLLDYLGWRSGGISKPLVESYQLFNIIATKVKMQKENNEVKEAKEEIKKKE